MYGYRVCENGVVFISSAGEKAGAVLQKIKNDVEEKYGKDTLSIETKILTGDAVITRASCMRNIIAFCSEAGSRLAYIDYLTNIYNRNALERDLDNHQENGSICYFIADLNDLKIVNDTIGHSAGDKLLQNFARLLTEAVGEDGRAYRQGGDEFAILYDKDARRLINSLDKLCRDYNQSCTVPISYAIGYCLIKDENFRDVADQMMYADKRKKKQQR